MKYRSLADVRQSIENHETTLPGVVDYFLKNIASSELNAFLEVFEDEAREKAKIIQQKIDSGKAGRLAGMVLGIKDNLLFKHHKVSASSRILDSFESLFDATAVARLIEEDAIIVGRLNCDEFAMGGSNENSAFGPVKNPVNPAYVPGGSSGGSAAAVAGDLVLAALGSDTGGSIRQPASFCGVVGLKPTYGRISRYGLIAYASSFDQIGPITHTVEDAALLLEVMAGQDEFDTTASSQPVPKYAEAPIFEKKARIAVLADCMESEGLDDEIRNRMEDLIQGLKKDGHDVEIVRFDMLDALVPAYYVLTTAEASSNLSRYDGIHYGYRSKKATDIESTYVNSRTEGFGEEVKRRILLGTFVLSAGYYDAYYAKAQKVRRVIRDKTLNALKHFDFLMLPTTPGTAFKLGEKTEDPVAMYLQDIFTVQANLAGTPAISLPLGQHSNGLPFGIQLIGKPFDEASMLSFSKLLVNNFG